MINVQFETDISTIPELYSGLCIIQENGEKFLQGSLDIIDNTGKLWATYQIEIKASQGYPNKFPKLYETGNAFRKIADWHVNEDESCCIDVPASELIICRDGLNLNDYIQQYAIPYFANQKYRELNGYYLYGEYSHGIFGRIEFYQSKLNAKNVSEFMQMLDLIIKGFNPNRQVMCPFCHKTKFRKCHRNAFRELSAIKDHIFFDGKTQLIPFFNRYPNYQLPPAK